MGEKQRPNTEEYGPRMNIVVDTDIIFSALLREQSRFSETLLLNEEHTFFIPRFALVEIFKHKEKTLLFSTCSEEILLELLHRLLKRLQFIDEDMLSRDSMRQAWELTYDIDEKDLPFIAMVLELNGLLWTTNKRLIEGLTDKGFQSFFKPF